MAPDTGASFPLVAFIAFMHIGLVSAVDLLLSGNQGSFLSANYPDPYPPGIDVTYRATFTTPGPQEVRLLYTYDVDRPYEGVCGFDFFEIGGERYCGVAQGVKYIVVTGQELTLRFRTDNYASYPGFNITYTVLEGSCYPTLRIPDAYEVMPIVDMTTRHSVVFNVRACSDVYIRLSRDTSNPHLNHIEIKLGANGNTVTQISMCVDGKCAVNDEYAHAPLSCCQMRKFWITWEPDVVAIGSGGDMWTDIISAVAYTTSMDAYFLSVASNSSSSSSISLAAPFLDELCNETHDIPVPVVCLTPTTTVAEITIEETTVAETTVTELWTTVAKTTVAATTMAEATFAEETTQVSAKPVVQPVAGPTSFTQHVHVVLTPEQRPCSCVHEPPPDPSLSTAEAREQQEEQKKEAVERIVKELTVPKQNVSGIMRRYISAPDERDSSKYMGVVAGAVCGVPFGMIFLTDVMVYVRRVGKKIRKVYFRLMSKM